MKRKSCIGYLNPILENHYFARVVDFSIAGHIYLWYICKHKSISILQISLKRYLIISKHKSDLESIIFSLEYQPLCQSLILVGLVTVLELLNHLSPFNISVLPARWSVADAHHPVRTHQFMNLDLTKININCCITSEYVEDTIGNHGRRYFQFSSVYYFLQSECMYVRMVSI